MATDHVCVLGAGIIGLSTAKSLRKRGYKVTIVAAEHSLSPKATSQGAGGLWEPYKCEPFELVNKWALETLKEYLRMLKVNPNVGCIEVCSMVELHNDPKKEMEVWCGLKPEFQQFQSLTMQELISQGQGRSGWIMDRSRVKGDEDIPTPNYCWSRESVPKGWLKYSHAFISHTVVINSPGYLKMLLDEFEIDPDVEMLIGEKYFFETLLEASQFASFNLGCGSMVNCSGLGAGVLCNDLDMCAARGGIAMFQRPKREGEKNTNSNKSLMLQGSKSGDSWKSNVVVTADQPPLATSCLPAYIIPRKDVLVVGGTVDVRPVKKKTKGSASSMFEEEEVIGESELDRLVNNYMELYDFPDSSQCQKGGGGGMFTDNLSAIQIRKSLVKTWVGLRPLRTSGIRVEADTSGVFAIPVVHNYGHGGSGWTIHYGTCELASELLVKALGNRKSLLRSKL